MTEFGFNLSKEIIQPWIELGAQFTPMEAINRRFAVLSNSRARLDRDADKIGLTLDDMLISCSFTYLCNSSDFIYSFNSYYGNCYSFNGYYLNGTKKEIKTVTKAGFLDGLFLELYVGYPVSPYSVSISSGVHVFIDNQTVFSSIYDGKSSLIGSNFVNN